MLYNVPCTYCKYIFIHGTYYIVLTVRSLYRLFVITKGSLEQLSSIDWKII